MSDPPSTTLRPDLALPNELLHKVILCVLCDGIHSLCSSTADTTWEKNMMTVLHQVSPAFKAISSEIAAKAFDISRDVRHDDAALLHTFDEIFVYLSLLGARFRHPLEWGNISFQTIDCSFSSLVFAYALYLSSASLRRNASSSPRDVYESTHKVILSTLGKSEDLCARVKPVEITWLLRDSTQQEYELAVVGLSIVQGFNDLHDYGNAYTLFQQHVETDGIGLVMGARRFIHIALLKVEGAYERYEGILSRNPSQLEPHAYELPGVLRGLRRLETLAIVEDKYDLRERIKRIVNTWSEACPSLITTTMVR